jgi:hypothetical protein
MTLKRALKLYMAGRRATEGIQAMDQSERQALRSAGFSPQGNRWYKRRGRYAAVVTKVTGSLWPYAIYANYDDKMWSAHGAHSIGRAISESQRMMNKLINNPGPKLQAYMKSRGHV